MQRVQVAWFQLLVSATEFQLKLLPLADFQLFEVHCLDNRAYLRRLLRRFEANWTTSYIHIQKRNTGVRIAN